MTKSCIALLATGGTIAGEGSCELGIAEYKAGVLPIQALIERIPNIKELAHIQAKQIANIDSSNMTHEIWLTLARECNALLENPKIDGIVITHGTDTLEESAYFLNLVLKSGKPVVLTGSLRPACAVDFDGLRNLYNAVLLASNKETWNRGVMVLISDKIYGARDVSKKHTMSLESFKGGEMGCVVDKRVFLNQMSLKRHTKDSVFSVARLKDLPKVDILYSYCNDGSRVAAEAFLKAGARGLIVAGSGAGSIHKSVKKYLVELLRENRIFVVKSSRTGEGNVLLSAEEREQGFLSANDLNPQKARILLMLALTKTNDLREIQGYFESY